MGNEARFDRGTVRRVERTPQGGLRIEAALTRVGVLAYSDSAGNTWREFRPAETVFSPQSIASARGAPVTLLHPEQLVNSETYRAVAIGHVADNVRPEGEYLVADVIVQDADAVRRVLDKELREVSLGYLAQIDRTPGVTTHGERYDAVQTSLTNNHAALGPESWGRAGPEVRLRMDGVDSFAVEARTDSAAPIPAPKPRTLTVRGKVYRIDEDAAMGDAQGAVMGLEAALDAATEAITAALTEVATVKAKVMADAAGKAAATPPADAEAEPDAAVLDARIKLRADAQRVLGDDVRLDGLSARQIHEKVIGKVMPGTDCTKLSKDSVAGIYLGAMAGFGASAAASLRQDATAVVVPRQDADEDYDPADRLRDRIQSGKATASR